MAAPLLQFMLIYSLHSFSAAPKCHTPLSSGPPVLWQSAHRNFFSEEAPASSKLYGSHKGILSASKFKFRLSAVHSPRIGHLPNWLFNRTPTSCAGRRLLTWALGLSRP